MVEYLSQAARKVLIILLRSDNCVKNHFYSKLRKAVRRLNKLVLEHQERQLHIIKLAVLYKIIETTEERFKNNTKMDEEVVETCVGKQV